MAAPEIPCEIRDLARAIALPRHSDKSALAEHPGGAQGNDGRVGGTDEFLGVGGVVHTWGSAVVLCYGI